MRIRIAKVAICWVLLSVAAMAQPLRGTGSISGTVRDASGGVIPDAAVELQNPSRGIRRSTKTDASGTFAEAAGSCRFLPRDAGTEWIELGLKM